MLKASKEKGGAANICVITSTDGKIPFPLVGLYGSTKAALDNIVIFLSKELLPDGIRINGLAPGLIRTEFAEALWSSSEIPPEAVGEAHHVGSLAAFVCSKDDGGFMNGAIHYVHGGFPKL